MWDNSILKHEISQFSSHTLRLESLAIKLWLTQSNALRGLTAGMTQPALNLTPTTYKIHPSLWINPVCKQNPSSNYIPHPAKQINRFQCNSSINRITHIHCKWLVVAPLAQLAIFALSLCLLARITDRNHKSNPVCRANTWMEEFFKRAEMWT